MTCTCLSNPEIPCLAHPADTEGAAVEQKMITSPRAPSPATPDPDAPVPLTEDEFRAALPAKLKKSVNKELMASVNTVLGDPEMYEVYRENLLSYGKVMSEGRFKVTSYIDAVRYVSHKLMGKTNIAAYSATFPEKIQRFHAEGVAAKDIASYSTAYNKSKLVNLIMEQTLVPAWVLNQDLYQQAINVQADLMLNARSEKVRSDAANAIMTQLKQPESQKVELNVSQKDDGTLAALKEATAELVRQQRLQLQSGDTTATQVANSKLLIEGEVVDD